eukprot:12892832-Prorocentrum_lima.AAC.1
MAHACGCHWHHASWVLPTVRQERASTLRSRRQANAIVPMLTKAPPQTNAHTHKMPTTTCFLCHGRWACCHA